MNLVERYLGAVRWNLPSARADDIVAELADVIANRIEEREDTLGRPLRREEIGAVLKEFGHPIEVAGRYHGQRVLIGPEVFPFYWFALQVVLVVVGAIKAVEVAGRALIGSEPFTRAIAHGANGVVESLLLNAAIVTLIFAVIEHTGWLSRYLERWKPEQLPAIRFHRPRRRPMEPVFEIGFGVAFILWWVGVIVIPVVPDDRQMSVTLAPVWATLYWPVLALAVVGIARALATLLMPAWKPLRAALSIGRATGIIAIVWMLHQAGPLVTVSADGFGATDAADVQQSLDLAFSMILVIAPLVALGQCAVELWRLYRER